MHSVVQFGMSKFWKDTADQDKIERPKRDVATLRYTVGIPATISATVWLYTVFTSPVSISQIFLPQSLPTSLADLNSLSTSSSGLLQWNHLIAIASTYLWLLYFTWDAKVAGMVNHSWIFILSAMAVTTIVLGPGGAVGAAFLWREYIITEKRHRAALTSEEVRQRVEGRSYKRTGMEQEK